MSWMDICASIAARRHSGKTCVTVAVDELHFLRPIRLGDIVNLTSRITAVHRSSCEIHVVVTAENPVLQERFKTTEATLTFVAIDAKGRSTEMPPLLATTPEDKTHQKEAKIRKKHRDILRRKLLKKS